MGKETVFTLFIIGLSLAQSNGSILSPNLSYPRSGYYMTYTNFSNVIVLWSTSLTDWEDAEVKAVIVPLVSKFDVYSGLYLEVTSHSCTTATAL